MRSPVPAVFFALFGNYYDHHEWTDAPQADALAILF